MDEKIPDGLSNSAKYVYSWVDFEIKSISYDINSGSLYIKQDQPFSITYSINQGTPDYSIDVMDNGKPILSDTFTLARGTFENILLGPGIEHNIYIIIKDSSPVPLTKDSEFNMEIR